MKDSAYKKYLLVLLLFILAFNFVDRLSLGLVMQDIKKELSLSDTQLGLLTGFAFALFYSLMGIPIARWADRGNRITIIALTTGLWSVMVALCGAATSFVHLMLIRVGIAVGEAGAVPPAHSLIADHFNRAERPRAMGIYMLGIPLSAFVGYFGAGWLNELFGWRTMFVILGLPGIVLALLAWFTLREPRLRGEVKVELAAEQPSMKETFVTLWRIPTFRHMLMLFSVLFFFNSGISQWMPTFFIRTHGFTTGELGTWFTLAFGISGFIGIYAGGALASRYLPNNERMQLRVVALLFLFMFIVRPISFMVPGAGWAFALMIPAAFVVYIADGPLFAIVQSLVPDRMRAMSIAMIYLCGNLVGMGLGPLAVGALSDLYQPWAGEDSLRYALVSLCPGYLWVLWQLWAASNTVTRDLEVARTEAIGQSATPAKLNLAEAHP